MAKVRNQGDQGLLVAFNMVPGTFPNMVAAADKTADYSKARLVDMRTLTEVQISVQEVCQRKLAGGTRSRGGNHGNRGAYCRPGCSGRRVWLSVLCLLLASSFVSFVCFGTKSLPV